MTPDATLGFEQKRIYVVMLLDYSPDRSTILVHEVLEVGREMSRGPVNLEIESLHLPGLSPKLWITR